MLFKLTLKTETQRRCLLRLRQLVEIAAVPPAPAATVYTS